MELNILSGSIISVIALAVGYGLFLLALKSLPKKMRRENRAQGEAVISKARKVKKKIKDDSESRIEENLQFLKEEQELELQDLAESLTDREAELTIQEKQIQQVEHRVQKRQEELCNSQSKVERVKSTTEDTKDELLENQRRLLNRLSGIAQQDTDALVNSLSYEYISDRQLISQKTIKSLNDELGTQSAKIAARVLGRQLSRYAPSFIWPKSVNHIEIKDPATLEAIQSTEFRLLEDLRELTDGVEITIPEETNTETSAIRLGGGYGIDKEAAKLTLEELVHGHQNRWHKVATIFQKHRQILDKEAGRLGKKAVDRLQLEGIHPEIQRMIGALNWRTSYRQNQYWHSIEVSELAGILAHELRLPPDLAKRCGLLHDIGKGLDYRIEGSHAVISGDYADRFGETREICDTVMSHHNDLVLETPLSYVLKTADTLSGARPGARVNLEEGYQDRLSSIHQAVNSFPGILKVAIMSGGREVHIEVSHKKVREKELADLTDQIARRIESDVAFPGQIKVLVTRKFEATAVA